MLVFCSVVFTAVVVNLLFLIAYICEVLSEDFLRANTVNSAHQKSSICTMVYVTGIVHLALNFLTILYRIDLLLQIQCLNEKLRT